MEKKWTLLLGIGIAMLTAVSAFGADGVIKDGRTLVPVRGVFESLGFTVNWDSATNKASISDGAHEVSVIKGMRYFKADGKEVYPDVPQQVINGHFYLPLKAIGDCIGAKTTWDSNKKIAVISYNEKTARVYCDPRYKDEDTMSYGNNNNNTTSYDNQNLQSFVPEDIKYYFNSIVPDFGAVVGINYTKTDNLGYTSYYYSLNSVKASDLKEYYNILQSEGFTSSDNNYSYVKGNTRVIMGHSDATKELIISFKDQSTIKAEFKYYPGSTIPDFGAMIGISPITEESKNDMKTYYYYGQDIVLNVKSSEKQNHVVTVLQNYYALLEDCGFKFDSHSSGSTTYYTKGKVVVQLSSSSGMFAVSFNSK